MLFLLTKAYYLSMPLEVFMITASQAMWATFNHKHSVIKSKPKNVKNIVVTKASVKPKLLVNSKVQNIKKNKDQKEIVKPDEKTLPEKPVQQFSDVQILVFFVIYISLFSLSASNFLSASNLSQKTTEEQTGIKQNLSIEDLQYFQQAFHMYVRQLVSPFEGLNKEVIQIIKNEIKEIKIKCDKILAKDNGLILSPKERDTVLASLQHLLEILPITTAAEINIVMTYFEDKYLKLLNLIEFSELLKWSQQRYSFQLRPKKAEVVINLFLDLIKHEKPKTKRQAHEFIQKISFFTLFRESQIFIILKQCPELLTDTILKDCFSYVLPHGIKPKNSKKNHKFYFGTIVRVSMPSRYNGYKAKEEKFVKIGITQSSPELRYADTNLTFESLFNKDELKEIEDLNLNSQEVFFVEQLTRIKFQFYYMVVHEFGGGASECFTIINFPIDDCKKYILWLMKKIKEGIVKPLDSYTPSTTEAAFLAIEAIASKEGFIINLSEVLFLSLNN